MTPMKKILVVDGNSIINRAFYGIKPLTTKSGKYTNAIYGMINIISRQLKSISPDYAAVAFDLKIPTFRHKMYGAYKAGRHSTPPELLSQFDDAKECLRLMGLAVLELPGYEADDIQGTVARLARFADEETESYILTGDRDLLQLIDGKTTVLLATTGDTVAMHRAEFIEKYGIGPEHFTEMKALMGDSSDNIPGVGGVGEKTAGNLIAKFGTLEAIYGNIDDPSIKPALREKLLRDKESAFMSRTLATIVTDAPIGKTLDELSYVGFDTPGLYRKFSELELTSFITKFGLTPSEQGDEKSAVAEPAEAVASVYTDATASEILQLEGKRMSAAFDGGFLYLCTADKKLKIKKEELAKLGDFFCGKEIVCYDGKALWHELDNTGVHLDGTALLDLMIYAYVLNPGSGESTLPSLAEAFAGKVLAKTDLGTDIMLELEEKMLKKIKDDGLEKILFELEIPLINVLAEIEKTGFKIDSDAISEFGDALGKLADELAERIYMQAGREFNLNSPKQLSEILYTDMGLAHGKKNKSGFSTDAQTLEELRPQSPIIDDILEYRQVTKLRSTYTLPLTEAADCDDRIHTDFKQALTATGRLSSAEPNLQNIPIKTKLGRELRRFFIAKDGYTLVDADYSQIELRILAHISGDYTMTEAFKNGEDIHRKTAAAVFGIEEDYVTEDMRKRAKAVNFGIIYGISGFSLAKDIGTSTAVATRYIKNYLMNYPSIDMYLEQVVKEAQECGYTTTPMGRRRYIPELRSQNGNLRAFGKRVAMNAPIQGAAADIMKLAMINVAKRIKSMSVDAKIVMQVHDEIVIEVKDSEKELCMQIVKEEMEKAVTLSVPLTVDVTCGRNWLEQA